MAQRFITKPDPIQADGKPWGLTHFIFWLVGGDALFAQNGEGLRSRRRIERGLVEQRDAPFLTLSDPDCRRLQAAAENPSAKGYPLNPPTECLPFIEAIRSAANEAPSAPEARTKRARKGAPTA